KLKASAMPRLYMPDFTMFLLLARGPGLPPDRFSPPQPPRVAPRGVGRGRVRAPAPPAQPCFLGEVSEGAVEAPSDSDPALLGEELLEHLRDLVRGVLGVALDGLGVLRRQADTGAHRHARRRAAGGGADAAHRPHPGLP